MQRYTLPSITRLPLVLEGEVAFKLYDTFGMPLDFMQDAARDQGIAFDQEGFDREMEEQKSRARASWKGGSEADRESRISAASKINFRRVPADSL